MIRGTVITACKVSTGWLRLSGLTELLPSLEYWPATVFDGPTYNLTELLVVEAFCNYALRLTLATLTSAWVTSFGSLTTVLTYCTESCRTSQHGIDGVICPLVLCSTISTTVRRPWRHMWNPIVPMYTCVSRLYSRVSVVVRATDWHLCVCFAFLAIRTRDLGSIPLWIHNAISPLNL